MANDIALTKWDNSKLGTVLPNRIRPSFLAQTTIATADVTGDGTSYIVIFDSEIFDEDNNYNPLTGIFTVPVSGKYLLSTGVCLEKLTDLHDTGIMTISTTKRPYSFSRMNYGALRTLNVLESDIITVSGSIFADMDANDTALVKISVSSSTKTVGINIIGNYFSCILLS